MQYLRHNVQTIHHLEVAKSWFQSLWEEPWPIGPHLDSPLYNGVIIFHILMFVLFSCQCVSDATMLWPIHLFCVHLLCINAAVCDLHVFCTYYTSLYQCCSVFHLCPVCYLIADMDGVANSLQRIRILRLLQHRRRERERNSRRVWVRPVLACREQEGEFQSLIPDLRRDPEGHLRYFRMSSDCFDHILDLIKQDIQKQDTNMRRPISPEERLAVTLR